ncbi:MAG TPA: PEP-CTERM sorting domain-containing protein [Rhizomicrobium sp.]|jgi:hypothetical protein|nr:PEP-CTERM sorting domain-containing protein [Rhizomicrobium sp.]
MSKLTLPALGASALLWAVPVMAGPLGPSSGFLPTYAGPQNGDLNITSAEAFVHQSTFEFDATVSDTIGTTPGVFYVWGIDRGTNIAPFGAFRPGVLFDAVVISEPSTNTNFVLDLLTNQLTLLTGSQVQINGDSLKLTVPSALLPSAGFASKDFLVDVWTRLGLNPADNTQIAEFDPSENSAQLTVPEASSISLVGAGLFLGAYFMRRRRK